MILRAAIIILYMRRREKEEMRKGKDFSPSSIFGWRLSTYFFFLPPRRRARDERPRSSGGEEEEEEEKEVVVEEVNVEGTFLMRLKSRVRPLEGVREVLAEAGWTSDVFFILLVAVVFVLVGLVKNFVM